MVNKPFADNPDSDVIEVRFQLGGEDTNTPVGSLVTTLAFMTIWFSCFSATTSPFLLLWTRSSAEVVGFYIGAVGAVASFLLLLEIGGGKKESLKDRVKSAWRGSSKLLPGLFGNG